MLCIGRCAEEVQGLAQSLKLGERHDDNRFVVLTRNDQFAPVGFDLGRRCSWRMASRASLRKGSCNVKRASS